MINFVFIVGISDTGYKLFTCVIDTHTHDKLSLVSLLPAGVVDNSTYRTHCSGFSSIP
jgi:hypothetical protein